MPCQSLRCRRLLSVLGVPGSPHSGFGVIGLGPATSCSFPLEKGGPGREPLGGRGDSTRHVGWGKEQDVTEFLLIHQREPEGSAGTTVNPRRHLATALPHKAAQPRPREWTSETAAWLTIR